MDPVPERIEDACGAISIDSNDSQLVVPAEERRRLTR